MADLGFKLGTGYGLNNADTIRSVVKSATSGGLKTAEDVKTSKTDKKITENIEKTSKNVKNIVPETQKNSESKVVPYGIGEIGIQKTQPGINVSSTQKTTQNQTTKIDNVNNNVQKNTNMPTYGIGVDLGGVEGITKDVGGVSGTTITPEKLNEAKIKIDEQKQKTMTAMGALDEYVNNIRFKIDNGQQDEILLDNIRKAYPEFNGLDDKQLADLTRDIETSYKLGNDFNLYNYAVKHPELYIEFANSDALGDNGKADYLNTMLGDATYDKVGVFEAMTAGLMPRSLGLLETEALGMDANGKEFLNNAWKSVYNAVATAYNFVSHPRASVKGIGGSVLGMGADYALKKTAESQGMEKDDFVKKLVDGMGDGNSFYDKAVKLLVNGGQMGGMMKDYFKTNYGSADGLANYIYSDPAGFISDAVSILELGAGLAGKTGLMDAKVAAQINKKLSWIDPYEASSKVIGGAMGKLAKVEGKVVKGVGKGIGKVAGNSLDFVLNKLTGISDEDRKFIKENPELAGKYIKGTETVEDIANRIKEKFGELIDEKKQIGKLYETVKQGDKIIDISDTINGIKDMFKEMGVKISGGQLKFGDISFTDAQQKALQSVYNYINNLEKRGERAMASEVWRVRQLIDDAVDWDKSGRKAGLDAEVSNKIKDMRGRVDDALKNQVEGFKEADISYSNVVNNIKQLKKDWFTVDGALKDNALSKIRNLTNKGNEARLDRLEKYLPGITQEARALGVAEVIDKATKQNVGQYAQQMLTSGGLGALLGGAITGSYVMPALAMAGLLTPKNFVKVLTVAGKGEKWIGGIVDKLKKGIKLSDSQTDSVLRLLEEHKDEIMANPEKYRDFIEKEVDEALYSKGLNKSYIGKSTEGKLSEVEKNNLIDKYKKAGKLNGTKDVQIVKDLGEGVKGVSVDDIIKLEKDFGDTTLQHEFFHQTFKRLDEKTYNYLLGEAKKYLKIDKYEGMLGKGEMGKGLQKSIDIAAEEWLAESFGVYARRKEINLGQIALKGDKLAQFKAKITNLFQKAYEWIQNYSTNRANINKVFNEIYGGVEGKKLLDETGKINLAEKLGLGSEIKGGKIEGGVRYKKGYHGSPANFEKFDSSHMGEGEGNQAHGWGHYVAVNKETGEKYSNLGASFKYSKDKDLSTLYGRAIDSIERDMNDGETFQKAKEYVLDILNNQEQKTDEVLKALDGIKKIKEGDFVNDKVGKRNLYEVEILDPVKRDTPTGSNYLEENGKIKQKGINKIIEELQKRLDKDGVSRLDDLIDDRMSSYDNTIQGGRMYDVISNVLGSKKEASKFLESLGYDGIHYFGSKDGESYVIFKDDNAQITSHLRYKKSNLIEGDNNELYLKTPYGERRVGISNTKTAVNEYKEGFNSKGLQDRVGNFDGSVATRLLDKGDIEGAIKKINTTNGKKLFTLGDDDKLYMNTSYGQQVVSVSNTKEGVSNYLRGFIDQQTNNKWKNEGLRFKMSNGKGVVYKGKSEAGEWILDLMEDVSFDDAYKYVDNRIKEQIKGWSQELKKGVSEDRKDRLNRMISNRKQMLDDLKDINESQFKKTNDPHNYIEYDEKGYSVMKKFVSDKQKKAATSVNKSLLNEKGEPYLWQHIGGNEIITKIDKNKIGEGSDLKGTLFVTNNRDMGESYGGSDEFVNYQKKSSKNKNGAKYVFIIQNMKNPLVIDAKKQFGFDIDRKSLPIEIRKSFGVDDVITTNDVVRVAQKKGIYDGVVFKDIIDYGPELTDTIEGKRNLPGGDVVAIFESNQLKDRQNKTPTSNDDFRYKKEIGKKSGLLNKDEYIANTEIDMKQDLSSKGDSFRNKTTQLSFEEISNRSIANFFEHTDNKGRYIDYNNGGGKVEKVYEGGDKGGTLFDDYSEKLESGLKQYKSNLIEVRDSLNKNVSRKFNKVIGKTGHGKDITISKQGLKHLYEKHGDIDFNTVINAINNPTNQKQEIIGGRYRFETKLDDGSTLVVGLQPKKRMKGGKVVDVNSKVDADLYAITSITKGKPRGADSLEVRLKKEKSKGLKTKTSTKKLGLKTTSLITRGMRYKEDE